VLDVIQVELEKLRESDFFTNVIQGPLWKQKMTHFDENDFVLPLALFGDDFEANNALGPHSGKLGAIYGSVACLPRNVALCWKIFFSSYCMSLMTG